VPRNDKQYGGGIVRLLTHPLRYGHFVVPRNDKQYGGVDSEIAYPSASLQPPPLYFGGFTSLQGFHFITGTLSCLAMTKGVGWVLIVNPPPLNKRW